MESTHHAMYLNAMFGKFAFEAQPSEHRKGGDTHTHTLGSGSFAKTSRF